MRVLATILLALSFSFFLAGRFFSLFARPFPDTLLLLLIPALGLSVLIFKIFPYLAAIYSGSRHKNILLGQSLMAAFLFAIFDFSPIYLRLSGFLFVLFLSLAVVIPLASAYEALASKNRLRDFLISCLIAGMLAFFPIAFLIQAYPAYLFPIAALAVYILSSLAMFFSWKYLQAWLASRSAVMYVGSLPIILSIFFTIATAGLVLAYPSVFPRERFLPDPGFAGLLLATLVISPAFSAWLLEALDRHGAITKLRNTWLWEFARENIAGVLLGAIFFATYSLLSYSLNHPGMDLTENFLAADTHAWLRRLSAPNGTGIEMRAVHPFAFFIFRPLVWFFSLFFNGDRVTATLILVPLFGGICITLAYRFIKRWTASESWALLFAAILGVSTAHLMFASLIESYIFSAAALLLFFLLLLDEKTHWASLVAVGVLTFGITITNFVQTFIAFVVASRRLRLIFLYGLFASAIAILLTSLHAAVFPSAMMFFDPAGAGVESEYSNPFLGEAAWRMLGRVQLLARNMLLYSIVAPIPFILTTEVGGYFPRFNFFKMVPGQYSFSSYEGLGSVLVGLWAVLLLAAGLFFIYGLIRSRKLDLMAAFPLVVLFNFLLHLGYGYEPFLYSANWTYALVLFTAGSLSTVSRRLWLQLTLAVFLALLMLNQWFFIDRILRAIAPFL